MYDSIVLVLFFAAIMSVWIWLAGRMKRNGRGWFMRQLAGSTAGTFAGLLVVVAAMALGVIKPNEGPSTSQAQTPSALPVKSADLLLPEYTVTKDEYKRDIKRTVEVQLPRRITKDQLAALASVIKAKATQETNLTFIGYRVDGKSKGVYWATTHYDPDMKVVIQGMTLDDYQALTTIDLKPAYPGLKQAWLRDDGFHCLMVMYQKDGKYFIDQLFADGGKNTDAYRSKTLPDGNLRLDDPESSFNEYYLVKADGTLEGWGESGIYMSLKPRS